MVPQSVAVITRWRVRMTRSLAGPSPSPGSLPSWVTPERIAVIKMSALGDVAKSIQTVRAIRRLYPQCALAWVIRPAWAELLEGNPDVDAVILAPRSLKGVLQAIGQVRRFRPDTLLDMQGLFTSGVIARASGARRRYTWASGREMSGWLTGNPIVPGPTEINVAECIFGFARLLGATELPTEPPAYLGPENPMLGRMGEALAGVRRPLVSMHIGASAPNKKWPLGHWSDAVKALQAAGCGVVLLGGPSDQEDARKVARESGGNPLVLAGRTGLKDLAAAAYLSDVFVGCDSGATHVATLVGTLAVCPMGPTLPWHSGPFGAGHRPLYLGLPCSPCYRRPTCNGRFDCMSGITAQMVVDACLGIIEDGKRRGKK